MKNNFFRNFVRAGLSSAGLYNADKVSNGRGIFLVPMHLYNSAFEYCLFVV